MSCRLSKNKKHLNSLEKKKTNQLAEAEGATKTEKGWWELPGGKLLVPERMAPYLVSQAHHMTLLGHDKWEELIRRYFQVPPSPLYAEWNPKIATPALRLTQLQGANQNPQASN